MGYGNSYSSSKTSGGSSKTSSYESGKVSSPVSSKASSYDSSKVSTPSSSSVSAKGKLGDIKRLLVAYLDLCQDVENKEAELEALIQKRDEMKAKIAAHPQASTITDILSTMKAPKNSTKR